VKADANKLLAAQAEHYANHSMLNLGRVPPTLFLIGAPAAWPALIFHFSPAQFLRAVFAARCIMPESRKS
jgi:hypothetical protein